MKCWLVWKNSSVNLWRRSWSARRKSKCKGPEQEMSWECPETAMIEWLYECEWCGEWEVGCRWNKVQFKDNCSNLGVRWWWLNNGGQVFRSRCILKCRQLSFWIYQLLWQLVSDSIMYWEGRIRGTNKLVADWEVGKKSRGLFRTHYISSGGIAQAAGKHRGGIKTGDVMWKSPVHLLI